MRWLIFLFLVMGCSGYRFSQQENPLAQYGIQSLSIPMFYNYSNIGEASADFTRETYRLLSTFSGLRIHSGYRKSTDAVLIGIIKTPERLADTLRPINPREAQSAAGNSIGTVREQFQVPGGTSMQLYLHVIVIKKPTDDELALLKSGIGSLVSTSSKIIFNEVLPLNMQYTREILDNAGTQVNATQNFGVQRKSIKTMAENAAISIRDMIFYAF